MSDNELRFILVGKTGNGKSALVNLLAGKKVCPSSTSQRSTTKECQLVKVPYKENLLLLVDTPGLYDTDLKEEETLKEVGKVLGITAPGFHGFIIVMKIGQRFTKEEKNTVDLLAKQFGPEFYDRAVIVFTALDNLTNEDTTFDCYIKNEIHQDLRQIIKDCHDRIMGVNNHAKDAERIYQIEELVDKIQDICLWKHNTYYTDAMYQRVEHMVEKERQKRLKNDPTKTKPQVTTEVRQDIVNGKVESNGWCVII